MRAKLKRESVRVRPSKNRSTLAPADPSLAAPDPRAPHRPTLWRWETQQKHENTLMVNVVESVSSHFAWKCLEN